MDENGTLSPDAPVYIYGNIRPVFWAAKMCPEHDPVDAAGDYRISFRSDEKTGDYFDR